jgi:hypothetical protein
MNKFYVLHDPRPDGRTAGYKVVFDDDKGVRQNFSYFAVNRKSSANVALYLANQLRDDMNDRELK